MKKAIIILIAVMVAGGLRADLLSDILTGQYNAKTISKEVKDSLLNGCKVHASRVSAECKVECYRRGEWGNEVKTRKISPNGKYEAYIKDQNLYIYKRDFKTDLAVTHDTNQYIFNGTADWMYNEEFTCGAMFDWSPDSRYIAFVRLDDREVASFEWQTMRRVDEEKSRGVGYPQNNELPYPRVGTENPKATLCIYDVQLKDIRTIEIGEAEYIPRIKFIGSAQKVSAEGTVNSGKLYVEKLNRDQNKMEVMEVNPKSGVSKLWYKEECNDGWVDYAIFDEWQWLSDGNVIVVSDRSGWRQIYLYAANGKKIRQLTQDGKDVTRCYGYDEKNKVLYYQVANTPKTRQNIRQQVAGDRKQVTPMDDGQGWCELTFSDDYSGYIKDYQTEQMPNQYSLWKVENGKSKVKEKNEPCLSTINEQNKAIRKQWQQTAGTKKEFFSFVTERKDTLYGWFITGVEEERNIGIGSPVVVMHYSGPGSQRVVEKWNKRFEYALAAQGYTVVCVDVRGTGGRGQKWLHETYMNLGVKEAEDLVSTAKWLCSAEWGVDPERMAIGGWSYGGFETLMTMSREDSPFKCGFAIAPVTDYRLYDSGYTERFMRRLQVNERGYLNCALPEMGEKLNGRLLIVHGLADDNVHCEHTWKYVDALVQAGKQFDMQIYPDDNHYLKRGGNYEHLHHKIIHFLNNNL